MSGEGRLVPACRLTVTILNGTLWQRRPLYSEIVRKAHSYGLSGASVFRGTEGFGASGCIHTERLLSLCDRLPLVVVLVDDEDKIHGFLRELDPRMDIESMVIDRVHRFSWGPETKPEPTGENVTGA